MQEKKNTKNRYKSKYIKNTLNIKRDTIKKH